ncbi:MAG TPA: acyl-CoA dehydrogenase family protein, partial [Candidatus Limnocylindria bacterium]|nr:acyl-CoA dehydrogenase family protein [Candidatus Limnocylindria bacterium]
MPPSPVDTARELAAQIRSCAATIEADRALPAPLFEALVDAGLFHLLLPRSLGCPELDLPTFVKVVGELGFGDASTAWIVSQCSVFATYAARMPRDVARAIWIDTPRSIVANTPLPTAMAQAVSGGYRVTGRQGFSTGSRHAAWLAAQAPITEDGAPRREDNGEPETRYFFVPAAEA